MTSDAKIALAKTLLIEATRQIRQDRRRAIDADRCGCGHRRDRHTVSTSVNYTQGFCMKPGCVCRWFMLREA